VSFAHTIPVFVEQVEIERRGRNSFRAEVFCNGLAKIVSLTGCGINLSQLAQSKAQHRAFAAVWPSQDGVSAEHTGSQSQQEHGNNPNSLSHAAFIFGRAAPYRNQNIAPRPYSSDAPNVSEIGLMWKSAMAASFLHSLPIVFHEHRHQQPLVF